MKKILVTGATGFIGNYVIAELAKKKHEVIATSASAHKAATQSWYGNIQYLPLNFNQLQQNVNYQQYFNNPEVVIHLAWQGLPNYKASFHTQQNLPIHFSFIKNLVQNGQQNITIAGTCFEYGMHEGCLIESMQTQPNNEYAIAKDDLRKQIEQLQQQHPFCFKWARLFYMYGAGQHPNSLFSQLDRALQNGDMVFNMSGGEQVRDYLPIERVAEYIVAIALQQKITGVINCCSGKGIAIKHLVQNYVYQQNKEIKLNFGYFPYPDYEPMEFWGDNNKLKKIINTAFEIESI